MRPPPIPVSMRDYGELYWIKPALWQFVQKGLVTDLLQVVRPGKEATVYLGQAGPPARPRLSHPQGL